MKSFILALLCLLALARSAENNVAVELDAMDENEIAEANAAVVETEEEVRTNTTKS